MENHPENHFKHGLRILEELPLFGKGILMALFLFALGQQVENFIIIFDFQHSLQNQIASLQNEEVILKNEGAILKNDQDQTKNEETILKNEGTLIELLNNRK